MTRLFRIYADISNNVRMHNEELENFLPDDS